MYFTFPMPKYTRDEPWFEATQVNAGDTLNPVGHRIVQITPGSLWGTLPKVGDVYEEDE